MASHICAVAIPPHGGVSSEALIATRCEVGVNVNGATVKGLLVRNVGGKVSPSFVGGCDTGLNVGLTVGLAEGENEGKRVGAVVGGNEPMPFGANVNVSGEGWNVGCLVVITSTGE